MSEGSQLHRPHPLSQFRSNRRNKRDDEPISDNKNLQAAFDQLTRRQSSSPATPRMSESSDAGSFMTASTSLHSPTTSNNNSNTSFTQRRMERGGNVPSSFSSFDWERPTKSGLSSSAGSSEYDSSAYYGLSPFVTSSFIDIPVLERSGNSNNNRYRSLSQRYQRERYKGGGGGGSTPGESDDPLSPDHRTLSSSITTRSTMSGKKGREDSDIELSDDEGKRGSGVGEGGSDMLFQMEDGHSGSNKSHRFDLMDPHSYDHEQQDDDEEYDDDDDTKTERAPSNNNSRRGTATFGIGSRCLYDLISTPQQPFEHDEEDEEDEDTPPVRPEFARIKNMLTNYRPIPKQHDEKENQQRRQQQQQRAQVGKLQHPAPRRHLLQTSVFQVVNSNTVKDRYLFLFNDLLLICKPIMDENIIDNASVLKGSNTKDGSNGGGKYRFRHNENSLFQVKNIVELSKVTLYLPRDEQQHQQSSNHRPSMMMDRDGRMSMQALPPPRKMHPVLATALHKFEADPADGIAYLVEKQVLANEPLSIANFLFKTPDLSRRQLGNYVSEPENSDIYDAFLDCFRMVALRLDEALRILLMTLRLPSNWDALEYTIERFAKKWHDANQNVVKFHEDMVVKVVVAMLFLNAEFWYDADRSKDVFWHAREHKERRDRQRLLTRRASMIDRKDERGSVAIEPLHYISALRAKEGSTKPSLDEFLDRWRYYDQYTLVPVEFLRDMYQSIASERLETGWDNGNNTAEDEENEDESIAPAQDTIITVTPQRFPTSLIKGVPSIPISITIPAPDPGLQIKLRGQDLVCEPSVLDFTDSCVQTFTITGHTLGRTSLMFIKSGYHASRYVSPSLPRTKSIVVERPFMRYTFQIGFSHADPRAIAAAAAGLKSPVGSPPPSQLTVSTATAAATTPTANTTTTPAPPPATTSTATTTTTGTAAATGTSADDDPPMVKRKYTFSVESDQERKEWLRHLKDVCGHVYVGGGTTSTGQHVKRLSSEERVALQVLKEVLLADEFKKGTANVTALSKVWGRSSMIDVGSQTNSPAKEIKDGDHLWVMQSPVKEDLVFLEGNTTTNNNNTSSANSTNNADKKNDDAASTKAADRSSIVTTATTATTTTKSAANVVTKRGHEIIKLVVQNSMVPLMLGFLRKQIPKE